MSEKFEVGGQCVCIVGGTWVILNKPAIVSPIKGRIYTIADIIRYPDEILGLKLPEISSETFSSEGFRPCKKTNISSLESFLKNPNKKILEDAI